MTDNAIKKAKALGIEPLFTIEEAAAVLRRSHWSLRSDLKLGHLHCIRIGRRILIESAEIRRLIDEGRTATR